MRGGGGDRLARSVPELLGDYADIMAELKRRNVIRSANSPIADYAESLFCHCFGWKQEAASAAGYDAVDHSGVRYQIKSRRVTKTNGSRQLSALRKLEQSPFDVLAGVIFDERCQVIRAALVPVSTVRERSRHNAHTNSWLFFLDDKVWQVPGVSDVTDVLRATAGRLDSPDP